MMGLNAWDYILWLHHWRVPKPPVKRSSPLRLGILGAAVINTLAIYDAVATHPDAVIAGVAARSKTRAEAQIKKYRLQGAKAYDGYAALLADPTIDAVYIPLPNSLHHEWACRAMQAGKHVLCEKPMASNAEQVRNIARVSRQTGKIALEAFHWRFYPAAHVIKDLIESGNYGEVRSIKATMALPRGLMPKDDIRMQYDLAGGACMDLAYVFSTSLYFAMSGTTHAQIEVTHAHARKSAMDERIDERMEATYMIRSGEQAIPCDIFADLSLPPLYGFIPDFWRLGDKITIELDKAIIEYRGFVSAWMTHSITITNKATGKVETRMASINGPQWKDRGQPWWTTYRYQLEAFVDRVREVQAGTVGIEQLETTNGPWVSLEESEIVMKTIDLVYEKAGMPKRV